MLTSKDVRGAVIAAAGRCALTVTYNKITDTSVEVAGIASSAAPNLKWSVLLILEESSIRVELGGRLDSPRDYDSATMKQVKNLVSQLAFFTGSLERFEKELRFAGVRRVRTSLTIDIRAQRGSL